MKSISTLFLLFLSITLHAQLDIKWSERQLYDNKYDGFFKSFIGSNSKYIYAKYGGYNDKKFSIRFIAFEKTTMTKVKSVMVTDVKKDPSLKEKYKDLSYYKTIIFENTLYVFWTKNQSGKEELFVQTFDNNLNRLNDLKKVYELVSDKKKAKKASLFVMGNKNSNERILIGGELAADKEESVVVEYKLLNNDFSFASSNQITLPIKITDKSTGLTSSYQFGDDGNLYVKTYVNMSKEERKNAKKGESTRFPIFTIVNLISGELQPYTIKFENKNIFNFDFIVKDNSLKLFGFFCDLAKDPRGDETHGIFYSIIDNKSFIAENMTFTYFTQEQLNDLYAQDKEDRTGKVSKKSNKPVDSEEESITSDYVIENVQSLDKNNIVLFCSRMRNYTREVCNTDSKGRTTCRTVYYCEKRNVTAFKISQTGKLVWASNMDRSYTYNGWDVYDVSVINRGDKFYVTYGSAYYMSADDKNKKSRKSGKYKTDKFEYAIFDNNDGHFQKAEYQVNALNVEKENIKYVNATKISVLDNQFYVNSSKTKVKTEALIGGIAACFVCPVATWIILNNGSSQTGTGHIGLIDPIN